MAIESEGKLRVRPGLIVELHEFEFSYVRSSGAGGQNVNKVSSKAVLRWNPVTSPSLSEGVRARFLESFGSRLTTAGDLIIGSDTHRDQGRNRAECLERLAAMLEAVAVAPKTRKKTKPTKGSQRRRIEGKKKRGETKSLRKPIR